MCLLSSPCCKLEVYTCKTVGNYEVNCVPCTEAESEDRAFHLLDIHKSGIQQVRHAKMWNAAASLAR